VVLDLRENSRFSVLLSTKFQLTRYIKQLKAKEQYLVHMYASLNTHEGMLVSDSSPELPCFIYVSDFQTGVREDILGGT
jgi:hypothetical protein